MLQAEEAAKAKALRLELAFTGAAGQRQVGGQRGKRQNRLRNNLCNDLVPALPIPATHTHTHTQVKPESDQASRAKYQLTVN